MRVSDLSIAILCGAITVIASFWAVPWIFTDRALPGLRVGTLAVGGMRHVDLAGALTQYQAQLDNHVLPVVLHDEPLTLTMQELGARIDTVATTQKIQEASWMGRGVQWPEVITPQVVVDGSRVHQSLQEKAPNTIVVPRDASLTVTPTHQVVLVPGAAGEAIDIAPLVLAIAEHIVGSTTQPIILHTVVAEPVVGDHEVVGAQSIATTLLRSGIIVTHEDRQWTVSPTIVRRLIAFAPVGDATNTVLGVTLDAAATETYLTNTIAPEIIVAAQDARFVRAPDGRVEQFSQAQSGQALDVPATRARMQESVARAESPIALVVTTTLPAISTSEDIAALGLTHLLARGESDFAGSPANRVHNVTVGTERYHGLLIAPGQEFSFNQFLGPVDGAHGFKPELVIKHNVTTPEFGGGLCQVSTTIFRAAIFAGLDITSRRNHAYPVRYYGTPGFDATIYPPYTDLRFINNTPGYVLIQAHQEGTHLAFELWGTPDDRQVSVEGPVTYDRQPNGAVKATLKQRVVKGSETIIDRTFYSRYKSPDLFPKVLSGQAAVSPSPLPPVPH